MKKCNIAECQYNIVYNHEGYCYDEIMSTLCTATSEDNLITEEEYLYKILMRQLDRKEDLLLALSSEGGK